MDFFSAALLGLVEGLTEFIPVSSSGHLILVRQLLHLQTETGLSFDAVIQLATILAVIIYFRKDLWKLGETGFRMVARKPVDLSSKTLGWGIILGTIPAAIFGLLLEKKLDTVFRSPHLVAYALIAGSILFWFAERYARNNKMLDIKSAVKIGLYQCLALVPGMSRSGATISGGLLEGLTRQEATRFSFLLSVPILVASGLKKAYELWQTGVLTALGPDLLLASVIAFFAGLASIHFLITYLKNHTLKAFIVYRIALAIIVLIFVG